MRMGFGILAILLGGTAAHAQSDNARVTIERAALVAGGASALKQLPAMRWELTILNSDPTQGARPVSPSEKNPPVYSQDRRVLDIDYSKDRQRSTFEGLIFGNQPFHVIRIDRPDSIFTANVTLGTMTAFGNGSSPSPIAQLMPESLLRRALKHQDSLRWLGIRQEAERRVAVVGFPEPGIPFKQRLIFDAQSGHLIALEAETSDAVMGSVLFRSDFSDFRSVGRLVLPHRISQRRNGIRTVQYVANAASILHGMPDSLFRPPTLPKDVSQPSNLSVQQIGADLYLARGRYNSLFAIMGDYVVVVEAPVSANRSREVLDEIQKVAPGKPIKFVIATHFHHDHIGGLRPFIDLGAEIITTATAREEISRYMPPAKFHVVHRRLRVSAGAQNIELFEIGPNPHSDEILIVWFPGERLLYEADLLDLLVPEGQPGMPGDDTRVLAYAIGHLRLPVDRIIPAHGRLGTRMDLERTLARSR